jgi:hypothetical protein
MRRTFLGALCAAASLLALAGCHHASDLTGKWTGPASDAANAPLVTLVLNADKTQSLSAASPANDGLSTTVRGTYSVTGDELSLAEAEQQTTISKEMLATYAKTAKSKAIAEALQQPRPMSQTTKYKFTLDGSTLTLAPVGGNGKTFVLHKAE